ncbi:MAG: nickel transporter permease [Bacillota bacterium]
MWRRLRRNPAAMAGLGIAVLLVLTALFAPWLAPYSPTAGNMPEQLQGPSSRHLLGTDDLGRDILSRIIYGTRITLQVGVIAVGIGLSIGVVLGSIAGFYGGRADSIIMRIMDIMLAFPSILLAIAIMAMMGPGLVNCMIAVGIVGVPTYARLVRGSILAIKETEYVQAARAVGNRELRVLARHVLPNTLAPLIVQATLGVGSAILEAAALGFLGLGAQRPQPEWGLMLADGRRFLTTHPHVCTYPGLAIMLVVLGFNLFGDGLRDALDPRLRT